MKKLFLLALVLAAGVTLSGCLFSKKTEPAATPASEATTPAEESFSGTIGELLARGKSVKCISASEDAGVKTAGEFYIDGSTGRTKSVTKITETAKPAQIMNSVMTKEAVYTWVEGQQEGFLYPITKTEPEPTASEPTAADQNLPAPEKEETKYDFNCEAWNVEENIFALPGDVTFVDQAAKLKELIKNIPR